MNGKNGRKLVHVGFGNYIAGDKIIAVSQPGPAPIKRMMQKGRARGQVVDLTSGRRTKSVIFTDSPYIILSALEPVTIDGRFGELK